MSATRNSTGFANGKPGCCAYCITYRWRDQLYGDTAREKMHIVAGGEEEFDMTLTVWSVTSKAPPTYAPQFTIKTQPP